MSLCRHWLQKPSKLIEWFFADWLISGDKSQEQHCPCETHSTDYTVINTPTHGGVCQRNHLLSTFHHTLLPTVVNSSTSVAGNIQFPLSGLSLCGHDGPACFGWSGTVGYCTSARERNSAIKRRKCYKWLPC